MTQAQQQRVSIASIVTVAGLIGTCLGAVIAAYTIGDDRYTRNDVTAQIKTKLENLEKGQDRLEKKIDMLSQPLAHKAD